jgi:hypothetical protein
MSGAAIIRMRNGTLEMPEESMIPYHERAKIIFNSPFYTPEQKDKLMFECYFAEFRSHEHNADLPEAEMNGLAETYTVEMITSLNDGTI